MSVHIGEVHTDVSVTAAPGDRGRERDSPGEILAADRSRQAWLERRVRAEGFDD